MGANQSQDNTNKPPSNSIHTVEGPSQSQSSYSLASAGRTDSAEEAIVRTSSNSTEDLNNVASSENVSKETLSKQQVSRSKGHGKKMGTLLVVNNPATDSTELSSSNIHQHPVLQRLNQIPQFSPILQHRTIKPLSYGWLNEKSIVSNNKLVHHALEISPYINIGYLFQTLVHENAHAISVRQTKLTKCIKDYDKRLGQIMKVYVERQKNFAKYADKLNKVADCTKILVKCQSTIHSCKETITILNDLLPAEERLEPFVWGDDNIELSRIN